MRSQKKMNNVGHRLTSIMNDILLNWIVKRCNGVESEYYGILWMEGTMDHHNIKQPSDE